MIDWLLFGLFVFVFILTALLYRKVRADDRDLFGD